MEMKKLNTLIIILILGLLQSCAHKKDLLQRQPAQSNSPHSQCLAKEKKYCLGTFPYDQLEKKWWQLEYQFLDKKNQLHKKYNRCYTQASIKCSKEFEFDDLSEKFETLKSNQDITETIADLEDVSIWNDITIPSIKLAKNTIKEIWTYVLALKRIYNEIVKSKNLAGNALTFSHGKGVSITGEVFGLAGIGMTQEALIHNGTLALFCAPGIYLKTDVGIGVAFSAIQTLGCKNHEHYKGKFFSLELGVSAEMFGLPFSTGVNYSLGVDITKFLSILAKRTQNETFNVSKLLQELILLRYYNSDMKPEEEFAQKYLAFTLAKALGEKDLSIKFAEDLENLNKHPALARGKYSISYHLKKLLNKYIYENHSLKANMPNFYIALVEFNKHLSGCDAVSGSVGLSLSLSPVNAGMALHHYTEVTKINIKDLLYLARFTPKRLLGLSLSPNQMDRFKSALKSVMRVIPSFSYSKCLTAAAEKFYLDGKSIITILKGKKSETK
jgi:hypothetical protein